MANRTDRQNAVFVFENIEHPVITDAQLAFRAALQALVWERLQPHLIPSTFPCTVARTRGGRLSNARENAGDQIWSAAATAYLSCRVV